jgi:hypothetical protein
MTFEDAQDIAYRFALAAYFRKLKRLVGEAGIVQLADTRSQHTVLMAINDKTFSIKVTIECGKAFDAPGLDDLIATVNKNTRL